MPRNKRTKIAVIGGGSSYTPEIMEGLIRRAEALSLREVWLVDIPAGEQKLKIVGSLARRMVAKAGSPLKVRMTLDREPALEGADYVLTQMRVGGMAARIKDERIPLEHGVIGQETTGPGGFAKALRTIPVLLDVARDMDRLAPKAWLINFTNPSGIVTQAVRQHVTERVVGLCNIPINTERWLARECRARPADLFVEYVGCNHLVWVTRVFCKGEEVTARLLAKVAKSGEWPSGLIESLGAIPCGYHHYYYSGDRMLGKLQQEAAAGKPTRGEQIVEIEKGLFELYRDRELAKKPAALSKRGGALYSEAAVRLIDSIHNDRRDIQCVDTANRGALAGIPDEAVVEVSSVIGCDGPRPVAVGPVRPELRGLLQQVKAYEELTVAAAVSGDRRIAIQALTANPLVPSFEVARDLFDDLLKGHASLLPQFSSARRARGRSARSAR